MRPTPRELEGIAVFGTVLLLVVGFGMVYRPLGFIVPGVLGLVWLAYRHRKG